MIEWVQVKSTAIRKVGYDSSSSSMYIDFEDSDPYYTFCNVPEQLFHEFINARSVGQYYHQYIKDRYQC